MALNGFTAPQRGEASRPVPSPEDRLVIPLIVGTRPEAIKLMPIILALKQSPSYQPVIVSTGQHHRMVQEIFELAGVTPDVTLWAGAGHSRLNGRVAEVMRRFEDFVFEWYGAEPEPGEILERTLGGKYPAAVIVHGDTSSAMAAALSAFHLRIPVLHVEAGLRTGGLNLTPFPEELNRQLITCIASLHLAPTATNLESLVRENVPIEQVFVTGNTGIDALKWASGLDVPFSDPAIAELCDGDQRIVVVTAHRRENWGDGLLGIANGVAELARLHPDVAFVLPMHPNPSVRASLSEPLGELENVLLTEPLQFAEFARLLAACHFVITDSGGIQEEAPSLGKPVLVARETTERVEGVTEGTLLLVGADADRIAVSGSLLLDDPQAYLEMASAQNPYGDGRAAERIVAALEHILHGGDPPQSFGPGYSRRAVAMAAGLEVPLGPREAEMRASLNDDLEAPAGVDAWRR
jgi:UDP-N-acetylglucosamine 2-epimerase (non-hydrolysing)